LLSQSSGKLYKGHCADLVQRVGQHNSGVSSMRSIFP
jgi:predicted GIY-YIG superfamily endonuclease